MLAYAPESLLIYSQRALCSPLAFIHCSVVSALGVGGGCCLSCGELSSAGLGPG